MKIRVRYFASLREALGPEDQVVLDVGGTVGAPVSYNHMKLPTNCEG